MTASSSSVMSAIASSEWWSVAIMESRVWVASREPIYEGCEQMVSEPEPDCGASARRMVVVRIPKMTDLPWLRVSFCMAPAGTPSCDCNVLARQGVIDGDGEITAHLSQVLMPIGPSSKLKGYRTGTEVDYVNLRHWFLGYIRMASGSTF